VVFGFKNFVSASDRLRLFALHRSMVQRFDVHDEELRRAWYANKLKDFFLFRGAQSSDVHIQSELQWLSLATCGRNGRVNSTRDIKWRYLISGVNASVEQKLENIICQLWSYWHH
jgi:hypothetical protein